MSDGNFWRAKRLEGTIKENAHQLLVARRMLTEVLQLLGGPIETLPNERLTPEWVQEVLKPKTRKNPPPPVIGYGMCEECVRERRLYLVEARKLCMTCRRGLKPGV